MTTHPFFESVCTTLCSTALAVGGLVLGAVADARAELTAETSVPLGWVLGLLGGMFAVMLLLWKSAAFVQSINDRLERVEKHFHTCPARADYLKGDIE
jgi:F0F1-type ATP synthase assembly protein I